MKFISNKAPRIIATAALCSLSLFAATTAVQAKTPVSAETSTILLQQSRIQAYNDIQNLMGSYALYHFANMYRDQRYIDLFAKDPDTKTQTSRGVWVGKNAGYRMLEYYYQMNEGKGYAGHLHLHPLNTPIIEVAGDGQTAKGVWLSPGIEASEKDGKGTGMELTVKYAVDFKKENNEWKIWHLRINAVYLIPLGSDTIGFPPQPKDAPPRPVFTPDPVSLKPDLPQVGPAIYSTTTEQTLDPAPPKPYATWDNSLSYIP